MADTRNEIYSSAGSTSSQNCESKESSSNLIMMKGNSAESNGKDENKESDLDKPFSSTARAFSTKSESPILSSPRFGSTFGTKSFALRQSSFGSPKVLIGSSSSCLATVPKPIVLRPSQLAVGSSELQQSTPSSSAPDSRISNPFAIVPAVADDSPEAKSKDVEKNKVGDTIANSDINEQRTPLKSSLADASTSHKLEIPANSILTSPKFVPLGTPVNQNDESSSSVKVTNPSSGASGFVFGQNLHERVEVAKAEIPETSNNVPDISEPTPSSSASTNGTSEMLFSSVIKKELGTDEKNASSNCESGERPSKSLSEAAREYEEARAVKRKYEEVTVVTGEEDEANVLQLNCKLFAFDKSTSTWVERGRGNLRLNDMDGPDGLQSRVVIRTTGSLRVVLNTKIWAGMVVDRASAKSVRLTAMDNTGQIKVFLVMASPKEIEQLHHALTSRVRKQQCKASKNEGSSSQQPPEYEESASNSSSLEPTRKRPSLLQDAGGGNEPKI